MNIDLLCGRRVLVVEDQLAIALDLCEMPAPSRGQRRRPGMLGKGCSERSRVRRSAGRGGADIELEGEPVYVVADRLQQLGVPCLFTTGYESTEIPDRYKLAPRFEKPVGVGAIPDSIREQMAPRS